MILTPYNDPFFHVTLQTAKLPGYSGGALVVDAENGMLREVDKTGMLDYIFGGEYDQLQGEEEEDW